jgi:hypothetical protein
LEDFLDAFVGEKHRKMYIRACPDLAGAFLSFSHFDSMPLAEIANPYDVMAKAMYRGAACIPRKRFPAIDLLLPMVLRDGRLSFLAMQTKYGPSHTISPATIMDHRPQKAFDDTPLSAPYAFLYHNICLNTEDSSESNPTLDPARELNCKVFQSDGHLPCLAIIGNNIECLNPEERMELSYILQRLDNRESLYKLAHENERILDSMVDLDTEEFGDYDTVDDLLKEMLPKTRSTRRPKFTADNDRSKAVVAGKATPEPAKLPAGYAKGGAISGELVVSGLYGAKFVHRYRLKKSANPSSS